MFFNTLSVRNIVLFLTLISLPAYQAFAHEDYLQNSEEHIFTTGEKIYIAVLNENDLTNDYKIDGSGMILMPLIGKVHVSGMNAPDIEASITMSLQDGYILEPVVSVQTPQKRIFKSFYILGEVKNPGRYDIPDEKFNVLNAVALAGGFTYHANKQEFEIMRSKDDKQYRTKNNPVHSKLLSGDILIVKERFF